MRIRLSVSISFVLLFGSYSALACPANTRRAFENSIILPPTITSSCNNVIAKIIKHQILSTTPDKKILWYEIYKIGDINYLPLFSARIAKAATQRGYKKLLSNISEGSASVIVRENSLKNEMLIVYFLDTDAGLFATLVKLK